MIVFISDRVAHISYDDNWFPIESILDIFEQSCLYVCKDIKLDTSSKK